MAGRGWVKVGVVTLKEPGMLSRGKAGHSGTGEEEGLGLTPVGRDRQDGVELD